MSNMKTSLIIATYNWVEALDVSLKSILLQTVKPDEILIADDGSKQETKNLIELFKTKTNIPVLHIWHEDKGFRLAEIRNKAIASASGDYIIQIDGDIILHKNFIKDHKNLALKNTFISGSRVLLTKEKTIKILLNKNIVLSTFSSQIKNRLNAIYFPLINTFLPSKKAPIEKLIFKVRGCNMSFWKQDLLDVNGYNEDIKGWGREDSEIALRLLKKGLSLRRIKMAGIQYHIFHKEANKDNTEFNTAILNKVKKQIGFKTKNGIKK